VLSLPFFTEILAFGIDEKSIWEVNEHHGLIIVAFYLSNVAILQQVFNDCWLRNTLDLVLLHLEKTQLMVCVIAPGKNHLLVFAYAASNSLPNHGRCCGVSWNSNSNTMERTTLDFCYLCIHKSEDHLRSRCFDISSLVFIIIRLVLLLSSELTKRIESHGVHETTGRQKKCVFDSASYFRNICGLNLSERIPMKRGVKMVQELMAFVCEM
jgi:hypothetical protein